MVEMLENTDQITYFWYLNVAKVDSMFSQVNGRLETERTEEKSKSLDGKISTAIEVGGLLAKLGIGKVDVGGELSKAAGNVLSITSTLSPQNKVVVLMEYLQRANQLTVLRVDGLDEQATLARIAERPFQILHGKFDLTDEQPNLRTRLSSSEARNSRGGAMIEVPVLLESMLPDQITYSATSEGDFWPMAFFVQVFVRPGKLIASPIAAWWPVVSPDEESVTYWSPSSEPLPSGQPLKLDPAEAAAAG
jgi:hypothetical protein